MATHAGFAQAVPPSLGGNKLIWDILENTYKMLDPMLAAWYWKSIREEAILKFAKAFDHIAFMGAQSVFFSRFLNIILPEVVSYIKFKSKHGVDDPYGVVVVAKSSCKTLAKEKEALERQLRDKKIVVNRTSKAT